jgi:hypothetical protein
MRAHGAVLCVPFACACRRSSRRARANDTLCLQLLRLGGQPHLSRRKSSTPHACSAGSEQEHCQWRRASAALQPCARAAAARQTAQRVPPRGSVRRVRGRAATCCCQHKSAVAGQPPPMQACKRAQHHSTTRPRRPPRAPPCAHRRRTVWRRSAATAAQRLSLKASTARRSRPSSSDACRSADMRAWKSCSAARLAAGSRSRCMRASSAWGGGGRGVCAAV